MSPGRPLVVPVTAHDSRDRRLGGSWSPLQKAKNAGIRAAVRAGLSAADHLPAGSLLGLGGLAGRALFHAAPALRRAAQKSALRALPEEIAAAAARASFRHAGENLAACLLMRRAGVRALDWVHIADGSRRLLSSALSRGQGAVFVSAHLGPFELLPAAVAELGHDPVVVVRESYDPELDPLIDAHRRARGIGVIHRGRAGAATRIVRALRRGRLVGFLPDLAPRAPSIDVPFLGGIQPFPIGPQRIAERAGCPLLVGVLERRSALARSASPEPFELALVEVPVEGVSVGALTDRVAAELGSRIRSPACRADWPWMAAKTHDCGTGLDNARLVRYLPDRAGTP